MPDPVTGVNFQRLLLPRKWKGCNLVQPEQSPSLDQAIEREITAVLDNAFADSLVTGPADLPIDNVLRYHLGQVNETFTPEYADRGKRIRPKLCIYCCEVAGGDPDQALPVAAAIELVHNFTLIHDDIQDQSLLRRHRPTVWSTWGRSQAINAGDAMFAVAHLALNAARERGVDDRIVLELSTELHRTTLKIVEGQVLDLGFEDRDDVRADEYLTMITGKTAAIMRYACKAGAVVAGAAPDIADAYGAFGEALGVGFQVRDDLLGVWGAASETGKEAAGDIHRRKKTLPLLLLLERASPDERALVRKHYSTDAIDADDADQILDLMNQHEIQQLVQAEVQKWHDLAQQRLEAITPAGAGRERLDALVEAMAGRES